MDFTSPSAFCASAITVLASCAIALPHRNARQTALTKVFLTTKPPWGLRQSENIDSICIRRRWSNPGLRDETARHCAAACENCNVLFSIHGISNRAALDAAGKHGLPKN